MGLHTNITDRKTATKGDKVVEVWSTADLPTAVSGVITITENIMYLFKASVTLSDRLEIAEGLVVLFEMDESFIDIVTYSGTATFITGLGGNTIRFNNFALLMTGVNATFMDITNGAAGLNYSAIIGTAAGFTLGNISGGVSSVAQSARFIVTDTDFLDFEDGFTLINSSSISSYTSFYRINDASTGNIFTLSGGLQRFDVIGMNVSSGTNSFIFDIDPDIPDSSSLTISHTNYSSVTVNSLFNNANGTTGTFTAVSDAAITAQSITSVTDSSGVASFNWTPGAVVYVGQEVVISGYVTNTDCHGTFIINTVGVGSFEVSSIAWGSSEGTGSFDSDSVTMTDTGTTLSDGDTLVIDTDLATDYDGGATVYHQLTNTFQINRTFTVTQTGTWDTSGIDQTDSRILAAANPKFEPSHYLATAFVNNNATVLGGIVNNTFTDMAFGTVGSALIAGSTMERWKLIDEINGTFEYTGNEPFDGLLSFDMTSVSSGGTVNFRFKWLHDVGAGFVDLPDAVEVLQSIGSSAANATKTFPLRANKGDQIKPQVTRNSGSSGITSQYVTVYATQ